MNWTDSIAIGGVTGSLVRLRSARGRTDGRDSRGARHAGAAVNVVSRRRLNAALAKTTLLGLASTKLNPASATDNVAAGSLYMKHLLQQTGGDEATAIAGYYQGLSSVQSQGMLPETRRYVANVQALQHRFGG